ncbi:MAG: 30S ribosomal protein S4 [Candidatus Buchananbacteria bacterium]
MSNFTRNLQCKSCRRAGEKLFLKGEKCNSAKCPMVKRNFPPGMHGPLQRVGKKTNFGKQLTEKQKAKRMYGIYEAQFLIYFKKSLSKVGNTGEWLFRFLEGRLDNTIYRLGFAASRRAARQLVGHGNVRVNGKKVNIPSYQTKVGDVVTLSDKTLKSSGYKDIKQKLSKLTNIPAWLTIDSEKVEGKITSQPKLGDIAVNVDWRTIVEYYSK